MYSRVWIVNVVREGFRTVVMVQAKEEDLVEYLNSEVIGWKSYSGATEEEVKAAKVLGLSVYMVS